MNFKLLEIETSKFRCMYTISIMRKKAKHSEMICRIFFKIILYAYGVFQTFRHLYIFQSQEAAMKPIIDPLIDIVITARLCLFVFMMRKSQIYSTTVYIYRIPKDCAEKSIYLTFLYNISILNYIQHKCLKFNIYK